MRPGILTARALSSSVEGLAYLGECGLTREVLRCLLGPPRRPVAPTRCSPDCCSQFNDLEQLDDRVDGLHRDRRDALPLLGR